MDGFGAFTVAIMTIFAIVTIAALNKRAFTIHEIKIKDTRY